MAITLRYDLTATDLANGDDANTSSDAVDSDEQTDGTSNHLLVTNITIDHEWYSTILLLILLTGAAVTGVDVEDDGADIDSGATTLNSYWW